MALVHAAPLLVMDDTIGGAYCIDMYVREGVPLVFVLFITIENPKTISSNVIKVVGCLIKTTDSSMEIIY